MRGGVNPIKPTALALLCIKLKWDYYIILICSFFSSLRTPSRHHGKNRQNSGGREEWGVVFLRTEWPLPSSRDTHAQSLRGAYITQRSPPALTIFPTIFPLSWAFSLPARLHPPRDLSSFLCCFQNVFPYLLVVIIVLSPHAFLPFLVVLLT